MTMGEPAPDGEHGPHVLVEDVSAPRLADDDRHHVERVLRLRRGDRLTVGDGRGGWCPCRLGDEPEAVGEIRQVPRPQPDLTVGFALIKGGRPELVVQKLTELGIDRMVVFGAARSVVRWNDDKSSRQLDRLHRVAREAVMQSRQPWLPAVEIVADFAAAATPGAAMAHRGGAPPTADTTHILIGPEGGWADEERTSGLPAIDLGAGVLRAETAAVAAGVLLTSIRDGRVNSRG